MINKKVKIDISKKIANKLQYILNDAVLSAKNNAPVDTSSLKDSIEGDIDVNENSIVLTIKAGGEDYTGQLTSIGELGNKVDYAAKQEDIHGFLENSLIVLKTMIK